MPATLTETVTDSGSEIRRHELAWVSHTDGSVSLRTGGAIVGTILRVTTDPDDTNAPTDGYDVTLLDEDGIDVLGGLGADRDTATAETFCPAIQFGASGTAPVVVSGRLTLNV